MAAGADTIALSWVATFGTAALLFRVLLVPALGTAPRLTHHRNG